MSDHDSGVRRPPDPVFRRESRPADSPLAGLRTTGDTVRLTIPSLGSVTVGRDAIEVGAPDEESVPALWARLGAWAGAQWWLRQGTAVIPGTAVARNGRAVLLTGRPRQGASLLALALAERGWHVVADAVVPWADDGTLRASRLAAGPPGDGFVGPGSSRPGDVTGTDGASRTTADVGRDAGPARNPDPGSTAQAGGAEPGSTPAAHSESEASHGRVTPGSTAGPVADATPVTVDSPAMAGRSFPGVEVPAGRPRRRIHAPAAGDTPCSAVVILHSSEAVTDVLVRADEDGSLADRVRELFLPALVPGSPVVEAPEIAPTWMVSRPTLRDGMPVTDWGPDRLADHLADVFGELTA